MHSHVEQLQKEKLVAIIRGIAYEDGEKTAKALLDGGISFLEITLNTEGALKMIEKIKEKHGEEMVIGAGTVLNLQMAKDAVAAGSQYLVSPNLDEKVIDFGVSKGIDVWPGTLTPTEIVRAYETGATAVKVFPIGSFGVQYLKDIRGPLNHIPMMVTGGINLDNVNDFLNQGAFSVGLGGNLVNNKLIAEGNFSEITNKAKAYICKVKGE
ncbi:bifunctional 4-hydroxy-2-oxoglutarate aldolase/2-dehydro-3-deoxy-phosphogluconate aldolase [Salipaludibacillus sp. HK11]|uniref:bifunctional 4-hydroxy-2-oxoglutarate aldolase/2-dehydro-3-deoxy-phosphogluconate aldolase n=1 Tax=Salipaludibacillus sp. HK11 TaxID=3394320 RepID=UPI0039FBD89C